MGIRLFKKEKNEPGYLVEWKNGYIQFWEDWGQFLHPKNYNWLNFRPIWFDINYDKLAGENLGIELGLMGFNVRFEQFIKENERGREMVKDIEKIETLEEVQKKKRLKD